MNAVTRSPVFRYGTLILLAVGLTLSLFPGLVRKLFSTGAYMPHATCYLRDPGIIWLHVTSDLVIGAAYVSIALTLGYLVWKASRGIPFHWVLLAFGLFIVSCGFTHFMEVWTVWKPVYWLAGYVKVVTAVASMVTAIALFPLVPRIFRMVADVKAAEEQRLQLIQAHAALERAHQELAAQKNELVTANRDLEMFAYSVAHDLRSPARAITGICAVLQEDFGPKLGDEGKDMLLRLVGSASQMNILLRDLLEYTRISRGELEMSSINLMSAIKSALDSTESERTGSGATITIEPTDLRVMASSTLLLQVISNLLGNAIKYVPAGTKPKVTVHAEQIGPRVKLWIEDNGIGIDPQYREKIFGLFVRLHHSAAYPGTGLGLAIVQRAIQRMGGTVGVLSEPGQGSRFWVELAAADPQ